MSFALTTRPLPRVSRILPLAIAATAGCIASNAQSFTTLAIFTSAATGTNPNTPLVQGTDGNFYGTTYLGGAGLGTVFKVTPGGVLSLVHAFNPYTGNDAAGVAAGLVLATDGNFYGSSTLADGAIFKVTPAGTLTILHSFTTSIDGSKPNGLLQAADGNFYGTTGDGGSNGGGTVFKISPTGVLTTLHSFFAYGADGIDGSPSAGLVQGRDGSFYGTTSNRFFKITSAGTFTALGPALPSALIQATDGNFYGTTSFPGSPGAVIKITPAGTQTTLHGFTTNGSDGAGPAAWLIQATDGNFYGTTTGEVGGGTVSSPTIFKITPGGVLTTLHTFGAGSFPEGGVVQGNDGNLYGTTFDGSVFKLTLGSTPLPAPAITSGGIVPLYSSSTVIQPGEWVSIYGSNLASATATWNGDFPTSLGGTFVTINGKAAYLWLVSPTQINLQAPDDTATGTVSVAVTTASGSSTSTVTLAPFGPSFSLLDTKHVAGIILRTNGAGASGGGAYDIIGPTGTSLGYATIAAKAGDSIELFGVGFGPTSPPVPAGQVFSGAAATASPVTLLINNVSVIPAFAGLSSAGLYQINVTLPAGLGMGDVPLVASVGGVQTPSGVVLSLQ